MFAASSPRLIEKVLNNVEDNLAKETEEWLEEKIGGKDRLLDGKAKKIALNYRGISCLPSPILSLLAHLIPVFLSEANNNELAQIIIQDLNQLRQKYLA